MIHKEKVAIVTGAARGLGKVIAEKMLSEGARVMLSDVDAGALQNSFKGLNSKWGDQVEMHASDLSTRDGAAQLIGGTVERFGAVHILINNAGGGVIRPFLDHDEESLVATIDRNLWTCIWCCHCVLPHMVDEGYGRIVNVGAESVRNGLDSHAGYNAAKGGMHGMTSGLAREFAGDGITVNTVAPAGILTPEIRKMLDPSSDVYSKHVITNINDLVATIPMGRFAEMEEVAAMVSFVASSEASYVTGQVISVNGGSSML